MTGIVMLDNKLCIGKNGDQPIHLKNDLHNFQSRTKNSIIIYGRKTLETFPNSSPLLSHGRINIIFSSSNELKMKYENNDKVLIVSGITELFQILNHPKYKRYPTFVIGGLSIFLLLKKYIHTLYLTKVDTEFDGDKYLPKEFMDQYFCKYIIPAKDTDEFGNLYYIENKVYMRKEERHYEVHC